LYYHSGIQGFKNSKIQRFKDSIILSFSPRKSGISLPALPAGTQHSKIKSFNNPTIQQYNNLTI